jgi:hypothetical protein
LRFTEVKNPEIKHSGGQKPQIQHFQTSAEPLRSAEKLKIPTTANARQPTSPVLKWSV